MSINNVGNKLENFLNDSTLNMLSEDEKEMCDVLSYLEELGAALNLKKNDSSPGSDSTTPGFYKVFSQRLKAPLFNSLQSSIETGELCMTQRRRIIYLICKSNNTSRDDL